MSIENEINRISTNVNETFAAIEEMGGEVPENANSDHMAAAVLTIPKGASFGVDNTLTQEGQAADAKATGDALNELKEANVKQDNRLTALEQAGGIAAPYLGELKRTAIYSCSTIYLDGDTTGMTKENSVMLDIMITDEYGNEFFQGKSETAWQGQGSLDYPKKNLSLKLKDAAGEKAKISVFPDYPTHSYHLKANYLDYSMVRNSVGAQLAHDFDDTVFPVDAPLTVKSIPVIVYLNGVFNGCYTLNYKQDDKLFGMDTETNPLTEIVYRSGLGTWTQSNFEYRGDATETADMKAKLKTMMDFAANSDDATFAAEFEDHFDLNNAINYWLYADIACATDSMINNWTVATWDGAKWYMIWYDLDIIFGLLENEGHAIHPNTPSTDLLTLTYTTNNPIWAKLYRCFYEQIRERYWELRDGIANPTKLVSRFRTFQIKWSADNIAKERAKWTARPNTTKDVDAMYGWMTQRFAVLDAKYEAEAPGEPEIPDEPDVPDTPSGELPTGYTRLSYLESNGTQYIDTGKVFDYSTEDEFYARFAVTDTTKTQIVFGAAVNYEVAISENCGNQLVVVSGKFRFDMYNDINPLNVAVTANEAYEYTVSGGSIVCTATNTVYNATITDNPDAITENSIYLFAKNAGSAPESGTMAYARIYEFYYKENGTYTFHLVPALDVDGVPCMYDLVSGNTLYNAGTGNFAYQLPIPCEGITLDKDVLTFDESGTQMLTATVVPSDTTDEIVWTSNNSSVASVNGGIVTAKANGDATITATCGAYSASCAVSVSGIAEDESILYSLPQETEFVASNSDYIDTGIELFAENKSFTVLLDYTEGVVGVPTKTATYYVISCLKPASPWPGIAIQVFGANDPPTLIINSSKKSLAGIVDRNDGKRHKVVILHEGGTNQFTAYVDGNKYETTQTYSAFTGRTLVIGASPDGNGVPDAFWNGTMHDARVYNRVLSDAELEGYI